MSKKERRSVAYTLLYDMMGRSEVVLTESSTGRREDSLWAELPAAASRSMRLSLWPHAVQYWDVTRAGKYAHLLFKACCAS